MLMYSWPFSPSSWTHFLFHNSTIHNDQALLSCEWVFQNLKRWGKPDASPKGTNGHKWTRRQVEQPAVGKGSPLVSNANPVSSLRLWASLWGFWGLMLMTVRPKKRRFWFVLLLFCKKQANSSWKTGHQWQFILLERWLFENVHLPTTGTHALHGASSNPTQHLLAISAGRGSSRSEGLSS